MDKQKILVIEDERSLLEVLTYNLTREGFEVIAAADEHGMAMLLTGRRVFRHYSAEYECDPLNGSIESFRVELDQECAHRPVTPPGEQDGILPPLDQPDAVQFIEAEVLPAFLEKAP